MPRCSREQRRNQDPLVDFDHLVGRERPGAAPAAASLSPSAPSVGAAACSTMASLRTGRASVGAASSPAALPRSPPARRRRRREVGARVERLRGAFRVGRHGERARVGELALQQVIGSEIEGAITTASARTRPDGGWRAPFLLLRGWRPRRGALPPCARPGAASEASFALFLMSACFRARSGARRPGLAPASRRPRAPAGFGGFDEAARGRRRRRRRRRRRPPWPSCPGRAARRLGAVEQGGGVEGLVFSARGLDHHVRVLLGVHKTPRDHGASRPWPV